MKRLMFGENRRTRQWIGILLLAGVMLAMASAAFAGSAGTSGPDAFGSDVSYRTLFDDDSSFSWITPRRVVWVLAQLHLLFAAFVLAVPMFVLIIELAGAMSKDPEQAKKYDDVAYEFTRLLTTAFSITSIIGAIFTFVCVGMYPRVFGYLAEVFGPSMYLYATIFFGESFSLYLYYYGWGKFGKWKHIGLGVMLNFFGISLMLIANAWTTFMMAPDGVGEGGVVLDRSAAFFNYLLHPINIHRLIANLCMGGSVAAAYAAYKFLTTDDPVQKARYDWMGYIGNFVAVLALLPLPFAGYYLGYEIYQYEQSLGIYMMGGVLSWLFVMQAVLIGALFFAANYYLWLGMDRIDGAERFRGWIKFLLGVITIGILVWATPKSLILTSAEINDLGGTNHPLLSLFGVMSAKNTAVNLIILATFLSFILYRRGNKVPTVSWAPLGTLIQAGAFGVSAAIVIVIGIGGYVPSMWMQATERVAMSPWQVVAVLACILIVMPVDILLLRGAKQIGEIRWGRVSKRAQYTLFFLAVSFTWLMALMGFVRSSLRKDWHAYKVLQDKSDWAFTPAIGDATIIVSAIVVLFFLLVAFVVWISNLGHAPKGVAVKAPLTFQQKVLRTVGALGVLALVMTAISGPAGDKHAPADTAELLEIEGKHVGMLGTYRAIDAEKGLYGVPIEEAVGSLAKAPQRLEPAVRIVADLDEMSPSERGEFLFAKDSRFACSGCHAVDGTVKSAPALNARFGGESEMSDGSKITFDEEYVTESLNEPGAKLVKGFEKLKTGMPSFKGQLSEREFSDLMTYLKSL